MQGINSMCSFPVPVPWHHFSLGPLSSSVASFPSPTCVQARPCSSRAMNGAVQVQGAESERAGLVTQTPACTSVPRESQQCGVRARPRCSVTPCTCWHLGRGQGEPLLAFPSPAEPEGIKLGSTALLAGATGQPKLPTCVSDR